MTTLFISDLHLTPSREDITDCFIRFMREEAPKADALYVLGDLFEFWIGDDDKTPFADQIRNEFKALSQTGTKLYFTQGNRDFLLGKRFCRQTGMTLLDDVTTIDLYGRKALILHGDTLCIDDIKYQEFRQTVHKPWLQWLFNRIPWFVKKRIVNKVQSDIKHEKKSKSLDIMDVNKQEVERVLDEHNVDLMIHGHTHRPDTHKIETKHRSYTRIVLGDWYEHGSVLVATPDKLSLEQRQFLPIEKE